MNDLICLSVVSAEDGNSVRLFCGKPAVHFYRLRHNEAIVLRCELHKFGLDSIIHNKCKVSREEAEILLVLDS
jgi:hypothetical protein